VEAFQATGNLLYRRVVEETLDYVLREMTSPEGPFYSTQDADSEGEEGKFYVWSAEEIEQVLGSERAETFRYVYDVTPGGNWEARNILHRLKTDEQDARLLGMEVGEMRRVLDDCRRQLLAVRSRRVWPGRDEKVLTSWNGLMIAAFALAGQVLDRPDYVTAAVKAADFILTRMRTPEGRLLRTYSAGSEPKLNAYLEDYAFLLDALISLYEATFATRWIAEAGTLAETMIREFWDEGEGGFFYTGKSHESLIARSKDLHDSSIPSGNSLAATALLRLAKLTGRKEFLEKAEATLRLAQGLMAASPMAAGQLLVALDFYLGPVQEFAVVGDPAAKETQQVLQLLRSRFLPDKVLAFKDHAAGQAIEKEVPLLAEKTSRDSVTTYVCQDFTCREPLVGAAALEAVLERT
jgi:uncharacterized protein